MRPIQIALLAILACFVGCDGLGDKSDELSGGSGGGGAGGGEIPAGGSGGYAPEGGSGGDEVGGSGGEACVPGRELACDDGTDDDADGLTDCSDDDCGHVMWFAEKLPYETGFARVPGGSLGLLSVTNGPDDFTVEFHLLNDGGGMARTTPIPIAARRYPNEGWYLFADAGGFQAFHFREGNGSHFVALDPAGNVVVARPLGVDLPGTGGTGFLASVARTTDGATHGLWYLGEGLFGYFSFDRDGKLAVPVTPLEGQGLHLISMGDHVAILQAELLTPAVGWHCVVTATALDGNGLPGRSSVLLDEPMNVDDRQCWVDAIPTASPTPLFYVSRDFDDDHRHMYLAQLTPDLAFGNGLFLEPSVLEGASSVRLQATASHVVVNVFAEDRSTFLTLPLDLGGDPVSWQPLPADPTIADFGIDEVGGDVRYLYWHGSTDTCGQGHSALLGQSFRNGCDPH